MQEVHQRFCAFADTLATYLGPETVYAGFTSMVSDSDNEACRVWLVIELLCSWEWFGRSASSHLLEFLCDLARKVTGQKFPPLLDMCFRSLLASASSLWPPLSERGPPTNALLGILRALLNGDAAAWEREDAEQFFFEYVAKDSSTDDLVDTGLLQILPSVLSTLMPVIRNSVPGASEADSPQTEDRALKHTVCDWLSKALSFPSLVDFEKGSIDLEGKQWLEVAIACFPLQLPGVKSGIHAASCAKISLQETSLLLRLLRRQFMIIQDGEPQLVSAEASDVMLQLVFELTLAKLVAVSVAYCWQDFNGEEWVLILKCLRKWVDSAVVESEETTEIVVSFYKYGELGDLDLQQFSRRKILIEVATTAISVLILLKDLNNLETVTALRALGALRGSNWGAVEDQLMEGLLRILLATGLTEAAALESNADSDAAKSISKHREAESSLWESLATVALGAPDRSRQAAVRAADLWGVGKGSISALYALLLSPNSCGALQCIAFQFLSSEGILPLAVTERGGTSQTQGEVEEGTSLEVPVEEEATSRAAAAELRPELAKLLGTSGKLLLQSSFTSAIRVSPHRITLRGLLSILKASFLVRASFVKFLRVFRTCYSTKVMCVNSRFIKAYTEAFCVVAQVHYLLGWLLLLMRLHALPPRSPTRERLLQFARDLDTSSTLLDCLFQHIPLDLTSGQILQKN